MYTRIMAVVLAVIVLLTSVFSVMSVMTLRSQQVNARLDDLRTEAREIAFLAAQSSGSSVSYFFGQDTEMRKYLSWKASAVYDEYGAYILVVDRRGRVMDNMKEAYEENPAFVASLNEKELSQALVTVLSGGEISIPAMVDGNPTFTVGVPFVQNNVVLGAVLIQTPAQVIEAGVSELIWPMLLLALVCLIFAGGGILIYVRSVMKPLHALTRASRAMADGNFAVRVETEKFTPEVDELSHAFNLMADKLAQVEGQRREFVANVSHELRSPITSISGFVQGMEDGTIPPEEHAKYLAIVGDETRRLTKLIGDLLALSRLERDDAALQPSNFDVCELLRRCIIRRVNELEARHMEVECLFEPDPCLVRADSDRIEQVVINLLDNAIKFTPDSGLIALSVSVEKGVCTVTVRDNGIGIPPEDRERVFERFFTADRAHTSGKGTGLGLSICQRIMEMHGQNIRLLDTEEGAAFAFTLEAAV